MKRYILIQDSIVLDQRDRSEAFRMTCILENRCNKVPLKSSNMDTVILRVQFLKPVNGKPGYADDVVTQADGCNQVIFLN